MNCCKLAAAFVVLTYFVPSQAEACDSTFEVQITVRNMETNTDETITVFSGDTEEAANDHQSFLWFLWLNDFDKFEQETGLTPKQFLVDPLTDIKVVEVPCTCIPEIIQVSLLKIRLPYLQINPALEGLLPAMSHGWSRGARMTGETRTITPDLPPMGSKKPKKK